MQSEITTSKITLYDKAIIIMSPLRLVIERYSLWQPQRYDTWARNRDRQPGRRRLCSAATE